MKPNLLKNGIKTETNAKTTALSLKNASKTDFDVTTEYLFAQGWKTAENRLFGPNSFISFYRESGKNRKRTDGAFLTFFPGNGDLGLTIEKGCRNFSFDGGFSEEATNRILKPGFKQKKSGLCKASFAQLKLTDYGLSDVLRLPDGRFILIDGGRHLKEDADCLMEYLEKESPFEKPVIAAWILTHVHTDHVNGFLKFLECYENRVIIERIFRNFPRHDDFGHYPKLEKNLTPDGSASLGLTCEKKIRKMKAPFYEPHTGEIYRFGDAQVEFLCTMEETIDHCANVNATSLVFMITVAGQKLFIPADASMNKGNMAAHYGKYLRADIMQVPHHGYGSIGMEQEIECYKLISPKTALVPVCYADTYREICPYRLSARYLMEESKLKRFFTGGETVRLELPYRPKESNMETVRENLRRGEAQNGDRNWFFTGLSTDKSEDFRFRVINCTLKATANLSADLFFEDAELRVSNIRAEIPASTVREIDLLNPADCNPDAMVYNPDSLTIKGIQPHNTFAVRILSDIPVVITKEESH